MFCNKLTIATRKSPLALCQALHIKKLLIEMYPNLLIKLIPIITSGDLVINKNLNKIGGKGLFVKELELAIIEKRADIAVHSMKDVPINLPKNLGIVAICKRENPLEAFISNNYKSFDSLPQGACIGTSSLRRQCQINSIRPDLIIKSLRGNIGTRLDKLDSQQYDAIILAVAGLNRLGLQKRIKHIISAEKILPAVGQGAIGIECNLLNVSLVNLVSLLNHKDTEDTIKAERAMSIYLTANCQVPVASYAIFLKKNYLWLRGLVGSLDGKEIIRGEKNGHRKHAEYIGISLAKELLRKGAYNILSNYFK